ncbi:hypothetical protein CC85DRAFT_96655 [Cutaneotrichosporon oleaginosum]|uniref:Uncharacterized protein n=1 Tax=Cutaneotrichosporon oleaginosum TaxID=879819 RepID=A0A0J0XM57_9TREE|nr:uncharacterized protein CC85DRAFT_96655 [Cutaneotrichosporon oleaginosum]KLT42143.1 hypothetical protein CC85DRAFT_96655 [Cutaneotrichosporon oleaginosum]TXT11732.1 hypothetical protein COLE_02142 [Cutaneotrichosporon oleaginosum]
MVWIVADLHVRYGRPSSPGLSAVAELAATTSPQSITGSFKRVRRLYVKCGHHFEGEEGRWELDDHPSRIWCISLDHLLSMAKLAKGWGKRRQPFNTRLHSGSRGAGTRWHLGRPAIMNTWHVRQTRCIPTGPCTCPESTSRNVMTTVSLRWWPPPLLPADSHLAKHSESAFENELQAQQSNGHSGTEA